MDKTLTFISNYLYSNSLENTYPIFIASKNENHDEIKKIVEELNELKTNKGNIFYSKALDKNVYAYFELIACVGD